MATSNLRVRPTAVASHLERLRREITRQREVRPDISLYLLIDRAMASQVRHFAARSLAGFPHDILFIGTAEADYADEFSPWLVALPDELVRAWERGERLDLADNLCQLAHDHTCVSWLWSRQGLADLAAHLRSYLSGCLWNEREDVEEGEVFLRYFDARILAGFIGVLSDEQRRHFLQPIQCWGLWDRALTWNVWHGAAEVARMPVPAALLRYTLGQQAALADHSQADRMLSRLADEHHPTELGQRNVGGQLLVQPQDERYRRIRHLIEVGRRLGLSDDRDLILHVVVACCSHPRYHEHPQIARDLRDRFAASGSYAATVARVDDDLWDALAKQPLEADWLASSVPAAHGAQTRQPGVK